MCIGRLFVPGTASQATIDYLFAKFKGGRFLLKDDFQNEGVFLLQEDAHEKGSRFL